MSKLSTLKPRYEIVVIGGGVQGAAVALEAARLGQEVLLVEKNDFCSRTSANSLRIIHGGLRYLRSADIRRSRESAREQQALMRLAPHLIRPLPCVMGTERSFSAGKPALSLGLWFYDNIVCAGLGERPRGKTLTVEEAERLVGLKAFGDCTGAVLWHDGQVVDSERLVLSYLMTAERAGAHLKNYTEATAVGRGERLSVALRSTDGREAVHVESELVIDTASFIQPHPSWTRAVNLVISRRLGGCAFGRKLHYTSADSERLFFAAPFDQYLIVGTWYFPDRPDGPEALDQTEFRRCMADVRDLLPGLDIQESDVSLVHLGRLPVAHADKPLSLLEKPVIQAVNGDKRVISVTGVKYTTARPTAIKTLARALGKSGSRPPMKPRSRATVRADPASAGRTDVNAPLYGAARSMDAVAQATGDCLAGRIDPARSQSIIRRLCSQYGSVAVDIARAAGGASNGFECIPGQDGIRAEIDYCIEAEHCKTLSDFLLRRSGIGSLGVPPEATIRYCAAVMGECLGWSEKRVDAEIENLKSHYDRVEAGE